MRKDINSEHQRGDVLVVLLISPLTDQILQIRLYQHVAVNVYFPAVYISSHSVTGLALGIH